MYVRTRDTLGQLPRSYLYDSWINGFGDVLRKPVLLTHYHIRKTNTSAGLLSDSNASVMTAAQMRPGYVAVADPKRQALQKELIKLVESNYLASVSPKVNLRIALVDLTEAKHHTPIFAGYNAFNASDPRGAATVDGASLPKILALYALYQLRFDLNTFAKREGITKRSALEVTIAKEWKKAGLQSQPNLSGLFRFVEKAGSPVETALQRNPAIHGNWDARVLILALGFEYIGSVALQSGLFDEMQGGLWLNGAYEKPAITWSESPFPTIPRHSATAAAAATYFTLLAQGRLVDQLTSNEIGRVLKHKCAGNGLVDSVETLPGVAKGQSPNKCGDLPPYFHDALHVVRQVPGGKRLEYAVAVLNEKPPKISFMQLGKELDSIIAGQNP